MSESRRSQATTQRLELAELAEADICHKMGWQKLPHAALGSLRYWLFRFFDQGANAERDNTISAMLQRDEARAQCILLQSRVDQLEKLTEKLRGDLMHARDQEDAHYVDIPFEKDPEDQ